MYGESEGDVPGAIPQRDHYRHPDDETQVSSHWVRARDVYGRRNAYFPVILVVVAPFRADCLEIRGELL